MRPGDKTVEQLIASTERGLYITRFFYTRLSHNRGCVMTSMTRDGTFLIENGEIRHPVKDLRFTQSYVDALNGVEGVGGEGEGGEEGFEAWDEEVPRDARYGSKVVGTA